MINITGKQRNENLKVALLWKRLSKLRQSSWGTLSCKQVGDLKTVICRLQKHPELYKRYKDFIEEFINLGLIEQIPKSELILPPEISYYLYHHWVFKVSSTTAKLRVVLDWSANTTTGVSLMTDWGLDQKFKKIFDHFDSILLSSDCPISRCWQDVSSSRIGQRRQRLSLYSLEIVRNIRDVPSDTGILRYCLFSVSFDPTSPSFCWRNDRWSASVVYDPWYVCGRHTGSTDFQAGEKLRDALI